MSTLTRSATGLRTTLALVVAAALTLAMAVVAHHLQGLRYAADGPTIGVDVPAATAVLDSPIGHGADLAAGEPTDLRAGPGAAGAHSALVRITGFHAQTDTTIHAAGAPALVLAAGRSASTTVLLPVIDGHIRLTSDGDLAARVEVLATFAGLPEAAGSTVALVEAVTRPGDGVPVPVGPAASTDIGLTGLGGVPTSVRAAHVSLTVEAPEAATVTIGGQPLPIAAGTTTVSTIVTPSAAGDVAVAASTDVTVRLDVRGYVAEAAQFADGVNGPGAFWPEVLTAPTSHAVADSPVAVELGGRADAAHILALVWAEPAAHVTTLDLGAVPAGRTTGALVDPAAGAGPQLAVVLATDPVWTLRRGATTATVLPLGTLIGADPVATAGAASITVDSPAPGTLDLEDEITFTFTGSIEAESLTPLRIEVRRNGQDHGQASIVPTSDGVGWTYQASVREAGHHTFAFELVGRAGESVTTQWSAEVSVPGEGDLILTEDAVPLGWPGTDQEILETTGDHVDFATQPGFTVGDVIAAGISDGAPDGLLRRVVAIDQLADRWRVHTADAAFTDVFLQVERNVVLPAVQPDGPLPEIVITEQEGEPPLEDEEFSAVFLPADIADLEPQEHEAEFEAVLDDDLIDEPPTDWNFPNAHGFAPMAMPVPKPGTPDQPSGPSNPPPNQTAPTEGDEAEELGLLSWTFRDKGEANGLEYDMSLGAGFTANFAFVVNLEIGTRWTEWWGIVPPRPYPVVENFETVLTTEAEIDVRGELMMGGVFKREYKAPVATIKFNPITFAIGPIPVVITFEFRAELKAQLRASAKFQLSFRSVTHVLHRYGFRFRHDTGSSLINDNTTTYGDPVMGKESVFTGKVTAQAGPELSVQILLYDSVGPRIGIGLKAGLDLSVEIGGETAVSKVELYLQGHLFLRVTGRLPIIGTELVDELLLDVPFRWIVKRWSENEPVPTDPPTDDPTDPPTDDPTEGPTDPPPGDVIDAAEFAEAMNLTEFWWDGEYRLEFRPVEVTGASWVNGPPRPNAVGLVEGNFPSYGEGQLTSDVLPVLSTGHRNAFFGDESDGVATPSQRGSDIWDATTLRIDVARPAAASCVAVEYLFGSGDAWVEGREDLFVLEWGTTSWTSDGAGTIHAPDSVISQVNADNNVWSDVVRAHPDTFYNDVGSHPELRLAATASMVTWFDLPADDSSSLYLSIADVGDATGSTAVAIQNITFYPEYQCDTMRTSTTRTFIWQG